MTTRHYQFDQCQKSDKTPFFIYEDLEFLIKNWMDVKNNPEKSSTTKLENIFQKDFQCITYFHLNT